MRLFIPAHRVTLRRMERSSDSANVAGWRRWLRARSKTALALAAVVGLGIFWALGSVFAAPAEVGHDGSLMGPGFIAVVAALFVGVVGLALTSAVWRTLLGRGADPLLVLFAAAAGLASLSWRAGSMTDVLQNHSTGIFVGLCFEQILLAAGLLACWLAVVRFDTGRTPTEELTGGRDPLTALFVTAAVMAVCVWFLAATDAKKQVMMAVGVGGFAGAAVAYASLEIDAGLYYAAAPLLVGAFGYLLAFFNPGDARIGVTGQPLAYPLPLDYASVGVVGALFGFWTAQAWRLESL